MDLPCVTLIGWPTLMSQETAARYLSLDESQFLKLASLFAVGPVQLGVGTERWRKADIDALVKRLPKKPAFRSDRHKGQPSLDEPTIDRIAKTVARELGSGPFQAAKLVSVKDAAGILGIGRTTLYGLIKKGQLSTRRIGSRTLILRDDIERLLSN